MLEIDILGMLTEINMQQKKTIATIFLFVCYDYCSLDVIQFITHRAVLSHERRGMASGTNCKLLEFSQWNRFADAFDVLLSMLALVSVRRSLFFLQWISAGRRYIALCAEKDQCARRDEETKCGVKETRNQRKICKFRKTANLGIESTQKRENKRQIVCFCFSFNRKTVGDKRMYTTREAIKMKSVKCVSFFSVSSTWRMYILL